MGTESCFQNLLPFAAMVAATCIITGLKVISKAAMSRGMSHFVFIVYSNSLGTVLLFLVHIFSPRKKRIPITFPTLGKFFILGLIGITLVQNFMFTGLDYSSPTLSSALSNLEPALTFLLAVIFRMEKVDIRCFRSQIKILGTVVSVLGALMVTLYKGPALWASHPSNALVGPQLPPLSEPNNMFSSASSWVIGGFCFAVVAAATAATNVFQASVLKGCPSEITVILFYSLFGTLQCSVVSLIGERNPNAWKLRPDIELAAIVYTAVGGSVFMYCLTAWCIVKKGPVFVAMFGPLGVVIATLMGAVFLGEALHVGSAVGSVIIVSGFYGVVWAQSKDREFDAGCAGQLPLLQDHSQI
uniref:WAT1-related protein n=1 Tax=Kalanchoe fedtschenkoi TaxID=63787 RepID=A0A7N0U3A5_KALFE